MITYKWHGPFTSTEVSALHEEAFGGQGNSRGVGDWGAGTRDWRAQVERHSLGWVCARDGDDLAGFVNVAWDGGVHAFILDTLVAAGMRRQGIGTRLVALADLVNGLLSPAGVAGADVDGEPGVRQLARDLLADALVGAGDECGGIVHGVDPARWRAG